MPPQIPFIIGNEACERFSFYGMRNILTVFLIDWLLRNSVPGQAEREGAAKAVFHLFVFGVYFTPLLGGFIADRLLGKYRTILYISLLYCAGHACLAMFSAAVRAFYLVLVRIAQSRSRWTLSGSGPLRASGGGGRRREGGVPGAVDLRLHPVLLDVVRSEGLDLGSAGALDEPADRFVELRAGADAARESRAG